MNGPGEPTGTAFGWGLVVIGLVVTGVGLTWVFAPSFLRLGRLPGDIVVEGKNTRFYFPIVTCLVISAVLSLIMWLIRLAAR
jgi:Protein of unknown function (DUF2905)